MPAAPARIMLDLCHSDESNRKISLFVVRSVDPSIADLLQKCGAKE
jgi:hypothetical protein